jgi:DUF4097 and DUF4098 domain-containing protein YvlB
MLMLAAALLTALAGTGHTDTTLTVKTGDRLEISNFSGDVTVTGWDRGDVRIEADHSVRTQVGLDRRPGVLRLSSIGYRSPAGVVDYQIHVPTWMGLDISGPFTDVTVEGARGDLKVETVKGDVNVDGGEGSVELSSVQGDVSLENAKGRIKLNSINQGVTVTKVSGQLEAQTVNGDIVIDDVQLDALDASSVSGDLWFDGALLRNGRYRLATHEGTIQIVLPDHPNANVSVSTFSGDFSSDQGVLMNGSEGNRRSQFVLGAGGPQLNLESFSGSIQLLKSSTVEALKNKMEAAPHAETKSETHESKHEHTKTSKHKSSDSEE